MEWGQYGVRTEPVHNERLVENERQAFWQNDFDRKGFRKQFAKLSHDDRLTAIEDLASKGINLKYKDRKTGVVYFASDGFVFGGGSLEACYEKGKNCRTFTYPFALGYSEEALLLPSEQFDQIDRVERTLLRIIAKHSGYVVNITRTLPRDYLGSGYVEARFPDDAARRSASKEVFDKLSIYGVNFQVDTGEELSIDEQIAEAYQERDSKRDEVDSVWNFHKMRKQLYLDEDKADREVEIVIEEDEAKLHQREIEFKEFERKIFERVKQLSRERINSSDGDSVGNE